MTRLPMTRTAMIPGRVLHTMQQTQAWQRCSHLQHCRSFGVVGIAAQGNIQHHCSAAVCSLATPWANLKRSRT